MKKNVSTQLSSSVMEKINSGQVNIKPRMYFILLYLVSIAAIISAAIAIAYSSSIIIYWFKIQLADTMAWGARANLAESIASFPWWMLIISVALIVTVAILVRRYGRMYKHKTSVVIIVLVLLSMLLGLGFSFIDIGKAHNSQPIRHGQNLQQNR